MCPHLMWSWRRYGKFALCLLPFIVLLVVVEVRRGWGYALLLPPALHLVCTILVVVTVAIAAQTQPKPANMHTYSVTILLVYYFVPSAYAILGLVISAAIVAGITRAWRWIVGFVVVTLAPVLVVALPYAFGGPISDYTVRQAGFLCILLAPEGVVLASGITRLVHPVAPASTRQFPPRI